MSKDGISSRSWKLSHIKQFCLTQNGKQCFHESSVCKMAPLMNMLSKYCPPVTVWRNKMLYKEQQLEYCCFFCLHMIHEVDQPLGIYYYVGQKRIGYMIHDTCFTKLCSTQTSMEELTSVMLSHIKSSQHNRDSIRKYCTYESSSRCKCGAIESKCGSSSLVHCSDSFCKHVFHLSCVDNFDHYKAAVDYQERLLRCELHKDGVYAATVKSLRQYQKGIAMALSTCVFEPCVICKENVERTCSYHNVIYMTCCNPERFAHYKCILKHCDKTKHTDVACPACYNMSSFTFILRSQGLRVHISPGVPQTPALTTSESARKRRKNLFHSLEKTPHSSQSSCRPNPIQRSRRKMHIE